jgi:hypothetical protein
MTQEERYNRLHDGLAAKAKLVAERRASVKAGSLSDQLEKLVDSQGIVNVLGSLARMCYDKAEHIEANWQDKALAGAWNRTASAITKAEGMAERHLG